MSVLQFLSQFLKKQEERVQQYNHLHRAFRTMLLSKAEGPFLDVVAQLTQSFAKVSAEINEIEKALRCIGNADSIDAANLIRAVQNGERAKLQATRQLHALRKAYEFKELPWQQTSPEELPSSDEARFREETTKSTIALDGAIEQINDALDELRCMRHDL